MQWLNRILSTALDLMLLPFRSLDPLWALTVVSLISGLFFLLIFKWTSDQDALFQSKQKVKAHLLELRLFGSDMVLTLRAQRDLLMANLRYLSHTLKPMLVMLIPVVLLLVQIEARYARRPLDVGDTTLLRVSLAADAPSGTRPTLELPEGVVMDGPPLRIPSQREVNWRLRVEAPGIHRVRILVDQNSVYKLLYAGDGLFPISDHIRQSSLASMAQAAEPPLDPAARVQSVSLDHPERELRVLGWNTHWLLFFFVVSVVPAYLVKGLFGVEV
jgi:uncharacterized membrane protein (DUF106 family)